MTSIEPADEHFARRQCGKRRCVSTRLLFVLGVRSREIRSPLRAPVNPNELTVRWLCKHRQRHLYNGLSHRPVHPGCTVDPLTAGRIRGPPRCAHSQSASCFVTATDPLDMFHMGAPQCDAAFSDLPSHV